MKVESLASRLGFNSAEEYFDYIVESKVNGQNNQVRSLYKDMDYVGRERFLMYLGGAHPHYEAEVMRTLLR